MQPLLLSLCAMRYRTATRAKNERLRAALGEPARREQLQARLDGRHLLEVELQVARA